MLCAFASPLGFIAVVSGWTVTEAGRQPYVVYGHLRTADTIVPVAVSAVTASLILFVVVYAVLLIAFFLHATRAVFQGPGLYEPSARPAEIRPGVDSAPAKTPAA